MPLPNTVHLAEYDPNWPCQFDEERDRLSTVLGSQAQAIEHIGSTAVVGMAAKPIVDVAAGVRSLAIIPDVVPALEALDYEYLGEYGLPNRHFFRKPIDAGDPGPAYHLHIAPAGSYHMRDWLEFRDMLRNDERLRSRYVALKRDLAARFANDRPSYTAGKGMFIAETLHRHRHRDQR